MYGLNVDLQRSCAPGVAPNISSAVASSSLAHVCPCGVSLLNVAPGCPFEIAPEALRTVSVPAGLTLMPGGHGSPHRMLEFTPPPHIALMTTDSGAVLDMLRYAGLSYAAPDSPAALTALQVFDAGRTLARQGPYEAVTFDWDHTLTNNQIFEGVWGVARARHFASPPPGSMGAAAMVAVETPRPFAMELAFGMMVGFAIRQGLAHLSEWERYRPQVGIATHTWPDRIGRTAQYAPILPLMEGLLPGSPALYERFTAADVRSVIHLHHFLDYTTALVRHFEANGFSALTPDQADELMCCLEDGGAHRRKPIGAWMARGWNPARLLHIDDSPTLIADLTRQAALAGHGGAHFLYAPHSHSRIFTNVKSWHMLSLPSLWRRRPRAIHGAVANLVHKEWARSAIPDVLRRLGHPLDASRLDWPDIALPAGTVMAMYPTPTTLGAFWDNYVAPVKCAQILIRDVRRRHGGMTALRRAAASHRPTVGAHMPRQNEVA